MNFSYNFSFGRSVIPLLFFFVFINVQIAQSQDSNYNTNRISIANVNCASDLTCNNGTVSEGCSICSGSSMLEYPIANAIDFSPETFWESEPIATEDNCGASASEEIVIDLGEQQWVEAMQLYFWQNECACNTSALGTRIFFSNDQVNWGAPVANFPYEPVLKTRTFSASNPSHIRYIRIVMDGCPTAWERIRLNDLKIFGITGDCSNEYADNYLVSKDVNPDELLTEELGPSPFSYSSMIGINAGPEWDCFYSPNSWCGHNPFTGMFSHVRSFHLMEKDYQNHNSPWQGGCTSCFEANASQCTPAQRGELGPLRIGLNGGVGLYKLRYENWKNDGFTNIQASLEAINIYCEPGARQFPQKWWDEEEWGGIDGVYGNAKAYGRVFAEEFCPNDWDCLVRHLEIGNEPWQYADPCFYQELIKGVIDGVKEHYEAQGIFDPNLWPMKLLPGAFQAFRDDIVQVPFETCDKFTFCPNRYDFIGDRIPKSYLPYLDGVSVHPYAFGTDNLLDVRPEAPANQSELPRFKSMIHWMNENMPGKKVFVSEVGWDSYTVGQIAQGVYMLRSILLMGKHHVFRTSMYTTRDQVGNSGSPDCFAHGLYNTSGLLTDFQGPDNDECWPAPNSPKVIYHVIREALGLLNNKHYVSTLTESDDAYAYLIGDPGSEQGTHIVAWKPIDLNGSDNYDDTNMYDLAASTSIHIPEGYILSGEPVQWMDGVENNLYEASIPSVQGGFNVQLGGCPILIPVTFDPNATTPTTNPICNDGIRNGDEQGVDCGSADCNFAIGQYAIQSCTEQGGFANRAVDGNTNGQFYQEFSISQTCWENSPWWQLDIGGNKGIGAINIWNRTDGNQEHLSNYWVILSSDPIPNLPVNDIVNLPNVTSYFQSSVASTPTSIPIEISARYIRIQKINPGFLGLAEVQVVESCNIAPCVDAGIPCDDNNIMTENDTWDGNCNCIGDVIDCEANFALNMETEQSCTIEGGVSSRAVDGNTNGEFYEDFSVSQTCWEDMAYWQVDLGEIRNIGGIQIWNRTDGNDQQLRNYHVLVSNNPFQFDNLWQTIGQPGVTDYFQQELAGAPSSIPMGQSGRYIRIQLQNAGFVSLAEVVVLRDCADIGCPNVGTPCDDFDPQTENDVEDGACGCAGTVIDCGFNVASFNPTLQSCDAGSNTANLAVDNNKTPGNGSQTCNLIDNPVWQVDLGENFNIDYVNIYQKDGSAVENLAGYHIVVSDNPFLSLNLNNTLNQWAVTSYYQPGAAGFPTKVPISRTGRYVRVQNEVGRTLSIGEFEVITACQSPNCEPAGTSCDDFNPNTFDDVWDGFCNCLGSTSPCTQNVALHKPAYQTCLDNNGPAYKVVDGNTNGTFFDETISQTCLILSPFLEVDLGAVYSIDQIKVYNRNDAGAGLLNNFHVFVSDNPFLSTSRTTTQNQWGVNDYYQNWQAGIPSNFEINRSGRYVRIQLHDVGVLSFAELEVIGCVMEQLPTGSPVSDSFELDTDGHTAAQRQSSDETNVENSFKKFDAHSFLVEDLQLFPNPAVNRLFVQMNQFTGNAARIKILNNLGQVVQEKAVDYINESPIEINTSALKNGAYFINISIDEGKTFNKKFVINK